MDKSFLSQSEVIAASRKFVCIRLATYENAEEAKFLKSISVIALQSAWIVGEVCVFAHLAHFSLVLSRAWQFSPAGALFAHNELGKL